MAVWHGIQYVHLSVHAKCYVCNDLLNLILHIDIAHAIVPHPSNCVCIKVYLLHLQWLLNVMMNIHCTCVPLCYKTWTLCMTAVYDTMYDCSVTTKTVLDTGYYDLPLLCTLNLNVIEIYKYLQYLECLTCNLGVKTVKLEAPECTVTPSKL